MMMIIMIVIIGDNVKHVVYYTTIYYNTINNYII